jgi:hypothetical protein
MEEQTYKLTGNIKAIKWLTVALVVFAVILVGLAVEALRR